MKYIINKILLSFFVLIFSTSCAFVASPARTNVGGAAYVSNIKEGVSVNNNVEDLKKGVACSRNLLYLFSFGDASIDQAKRNGGIENVASVNKEKNGLGFIFLVLPFIYSSSCTVVYGN